MACHRFLRQLLPRAELAGTRVESALCDYQTGKVHRAARSVYRTRLKMAHPRLTRSQRRRSGERSHRRRWLRVKRDNGNRVRYNGEHHDTAEKTHMESVLMRCPIQPFRKAVTSHRTPRRQHRTSSRLGVIGVCTVEERLVRPALPSMPVPPPLHRPPWFRQRFRFHLPPTGRAPESKQLLFLIATPLGRHRVPRDQDPHLLFRDFLIGIGLLVPVATCAGFASSAVSMRRRRSRRPAHSRGAG